MDPAQTARLSELRDTSRLRYNCRVERSSPADTEEVGPVDLATARTIPASVRELDIVGSAPTALAAPRETRASLLLREQVQHALFGDIVSRPSIGRYTYIEQLGAGGMGIVCAAYDPKLDRRVAIKLIRSNSTASLERRARMLREAKAMARLSHPNVVHIYDLGQHPL